MAAANDPSTSPGETSRAPNGPTAPPSPFGPPSAAWRLGAVAGGLVLFALIAADVHFDGGLTRIDLQVGTWVQEGLSPGTRDWFHEIGARPGDDIVILPLLVVGGIWVAARGRWRTALLMVGSGGVARLIVWTLKDFFAEERPIVIVAGGEAIGQSASFPSGHTAGMVVAAGLLLYFLLYVHVSRTRRDPRRLSGPLVALWVLLSLFMGVTRVLGGDHWPTDVVASWAFGVAWLALTVIVHERWVRPVEQLSLGRRPTNEALI